LNAAPHLKERILAAAAAQPSLTRPQARRLAHLLAGASIGLALVVFELAGGVTRSAPLRQTVRLADGSMLLSAVITSFTLGRGPLSLARAGPLVRLLPFFAPVATFLWMQGFAALYGGFEGLDAWTCFLLTLIIASPALLAFLSMKSGSHPRHPRTLGAAAGAMCGSWASMLSMLVGAGTTRLESLLGTATPLTVLVLAGALAGPKVLGNLRGRG